MGYRLIDCGNFQKFEQIGDFFFVRPSPQAVWKPKTAISDWLKKADAIYERYSEGKGDWKFNNKQMPPSFEISINNIQLKIKLTNFGHVGVFFEQARMWKELQKLVAHKPTNEPIKILNLFAYTGGATASLLSAEAEVLHLDASKTSVSWAKENAELNQVADRKVRWIIEDVKKFIEKEVRRGSLYNGIILDPPSYGRGSKNEVWKIEDDLIPLLENLKKLMHPNFYFLQLSAHSQGYTPLALKNLLSNYVDLNLGNIHSEEMTINSESGFQLPSGAQAFYSKNL